MDLEGFDLFDQGIDLDDADPSASSTLSKALSWTGAQWHAVCRRARWMDLIGDYAGREPFIVDGIRSSRDAVAFLIQVLGHSLIQLVIEDPLLALAKPHGPCHLFQVNDH